MRIFTLSHIGEFHVNQNEDFLVVEEVGKHKKIIAVMDGCSSGTDSHFASTLIGKLLRKLGKQESYREYAQKVEIEIDDLLKRISLQLFEELTHVNRFLDLNKDEILSTLILVIIDEEKADAEALVIGDGLIYSNGEYIEFENDNKPDYIGYHLGEDKHEWYETKTNKRSFSEIKDLSISTDGIFTFKNFDGKNYNSISEERVMQEFFEVQTNMDNSNKLKKSLINLEEEYGLKPSDDLTIIRVVF